MPMEGMDPMTRRRAKAINFGIIYGISAFGLARQLGIAPGEARGYIDAYFARYPGIRDLHGTRRRRRRGSTATSPRRSAAAAGSPASPTRTPARRAYAERQAINAPLQGGAADIIKRAMVRLPAALARGRARPRGCCCRCMTSCCSRRPRARLTATVRAGHAGDGGRRDADRCRWWWRPAPAAPGPTRIRTDVGRNSVAHSAVCALSTGCRARKDHRWRNALRCSAHPRYDGPEPRRTRRGIGACPERPATRRPRSRCSGPPARGSPPRFPLG